MNHLTATHRAQQLLLRKATWADLQRLWPTLNFVRLDETYPALAVQVAAVVQRHRETSSGLSAGYLRALRRAQGVRGDAPIELADPLNVEQFNDTLHSTSVAPLKAATARGVVRDEAMANALTLAKGAMSRLVLDAGRETVTATVGADDAALGWRRVLGGGGCDFCRMLAGRGAVYSETTVDFEAHGHCGCTPEPVYSR